MPGLLISIPRYALPEMTFLAPTVVPPIVSFEAPELISTPPQALPSAAVPAASVPIRLPWTRIAVTPEPLIQTPKFSLPEMRLPATVAVPPMVLALLPL